MNSTIVKALFEKRMNTINELQALAALTDGREPTAEEKAAESRMANDLTELDGKIARGLDDIEQEQRSVEAFQRYEKLTHGAAPINPAGDKSAEIATGLREFLSGEKRSWEYNLDQRASTAYNIPKREWEQRDLLETTGGMPLPHSFSGQLYEALVASAGVLKAKSGNDTLFITGTGEPFDVPRSTAYGAATWTAEGSPLTEADDTLSAITLNGWKAAKLVQVSTELANDEGFDIVSFVARASGRACGLTADAAYVVGDGSSKPTGFQPNATVGVTGPVGTTVSLGTQATAGMGSDLLVQLKYSVIDGYRAGAAWLLNDASVAKVAMLKGSNGETIWQGGLQPGQPDTLLGAPVYSDPNMPVMAANAKSIAYGNFNGYAVRIVRGVRFERSDEFAFGSDLITFRAILRTDGKLVDTGAIKLFQNSAT